MFFDKFAKLKSDVEDKGTEFTVKVFDDEVSMEKPVMWLDAEEEDAEMHIDYLLRNGKIDQETNDDLMGKYENVIYVDIVNTDSSIYFELPENRRNSCATALLKRFIKFYRENYDGELVSANFENYDLQEKFKSACEKGIFPKDSLRIIGETSKEKYDDSERFNIKNKENAYNVLKEVSTILIDKGLDTYIEGDYIYMKNSPVATVIDEVTKATTLLEVRDDIDLPMQDFVFSKLTDSNDYILTAPLKGVSQNNYNISYEIGTQCVTLVTYGSNFWVADFIIENEAKFREIFSEATTIVTSNMNNPITLDEFFNKETIESSTIIRLVKKSQR